MACITKTLFRTALIGGLAIGGLTMVVGPQRMVSGYNQVQHTVIAWFDDNMDNPVLLRAQLKNLQAEYPNRLRKITRSLAEVDGQIATISYQQQVSHNAVNIARTDLAELESLYTTANASQFASNGVPQRVLIAFQGRNLTVDQAYNRAGRIKASALNNQDKAAHFDQELEILSKYRNRLVEQKDKLDQEYSTFQTQLYNIQRQIDQIERNDDLIELMEECNVEVSDNDKFKARNLGELANRLSALQKQQEAEFETMESMVNSDSYVQKAENAMRQSESFGDVFTIEEYVAPEVDRGAFPDVPVIIDENTVRQQQVSDEVIASLDKSEDN